MTANAVAEPDRSPSTGLLAVRTDVLIIMSGVGLAILTMLLSGRISEYYFLAAYTILQFIVLGTAWNILGGYGGYINFGTAGRIT